MKRIVLAVLAGVAIWGLSACERSERPGVFEPAFGKTTAPPNPCPATIGANTIDGTTSKYEIVAGLYAGIDALFQDVRSRNGAKSHVDNIVREVCVGDYASAQDFLQILIQQIKNQPDDFLLPYQPHGDELEAWAQVLATDLKGMTLPEGALAFDGGLTMANGGLGAPPAKTRNGHVVVNAADFPAGGPFVIAIAPGQGDFGDYSVYGSDSYQITTGSEPGEKSVLVVFCGSYPLNLRIAHVKGDATVELLDEDPNLQGLCGGTTSPSALLQHAPGWLRSLARAAGSAARKMFGPMPLYARVETGLGGRTKSFSPFAVVDEPPEIEFASSLIGEYGQSNNYLFNWKHPALTVTGTAACKSLQTGFVLAAYDGTTNAMLGSTCATGETTLSQFSITRTAGATPPLKAYAKLTYPSSKTYSSNTVDVPAVYRTLDVALAGTGSGTVTSNFGGIACPATKCQASFEEWQDVILSATPDVYSEFQSWAAVNKSGGTVACALSGAQCGIRTRQDRIVTTSFKKVKAPLTVKCESRLAGSISVKYAGREICTAGKDVVTTTVNPMFFGIPVYITAEAPGYTLNHDIWFSSTNLTLGTKCPAKVQLGARTLATCELTLPAAGGQLNIKLTDS